MKLHEITAVLEQFAPLALQEDYDNAGLITGSPGMEVTGAVLCLDVTEAILDEAVARGANLVISHHPIVFRPLKTITGKNYVERIVIQAIRNGIALYAAHTNLDSASRGMSYLLAEQLGLEQIEVLEPRAEGLVRIGVHTPESHAEAVRAALAEAGAGEIGQYDSCSFNTPGQGFFRARKGAEPFVGEVGTLHRQAEIRTTAVAPSYRAGAIIAALKAVHPYQEMAYDLTPLCLPDRESGFGAVGNLPAPVEVGEFLRAVKERFGVGCVRHSVPPKSQVQRIAICTGSGGSLLDRAIRSGADVYLTADVKYDLFFAAEGRILLADIGHFESEIGVISLLYELLRKKIPTFALHKSEKVHNPVNYL
ncbi:MAG: Nif3-like dinuclear metal center hexameric protein [Rikenellaceae bacterium]|jgi:dinuclear metal center YbgI/SA1388 family protein|nr:Nif3-like dinuclear metal center hexameric protein [Rikenellaceae bacterium]